MNEHDYALRDAAMAEFVDSYFKARPQLLRTRHEECLVEAGFKAAWQPDQKERAEKAESELEAERTRLDWALKKQAYYARNPDRLWVDVGTGNHKWFAVYDDNPRATIDELIAGEQK